MQRTESLDEISEEILLANPYDKGFISDKLKYIICEWGLAASLNVLFRQQVSSGYVLFDPSDDEQKHSKTFMDYETGINFTVDWNPSRELRNQHQLLIERGIIDNSFDPSLLINKDDNNRPCYLCGQNITLQNPLEILLPVELSGVNYNCGANFAPITDNHFTIMTSEHVIQKYDRWVISSMIDLVCLTVGNYKAVFNGRAGASILSHLHLQATTEKLPVEDIIVRDDDIILNHEGITVSRPNYYLPLFIVSGRDHILVEDHSDKIVRTWISNDPEFNTQNIIVNKSNDCIRVYIFLRDRRRLAGSGKEGDMGTFECAGKLVLSKGITNKGETGNEWSLFENADLDMIKRLLCQISPVTDIKYPN